MALFTVPAAVIVLLRLGQANLPADLGVVANLPTSFLLATSAAYTGVIFIVVALTIALLLAIPHKKWPLLWWLVPSIFALVGVIGSRAANGFESSTGLNWLWFLASAALWTLLLGVTALVAKGKSPSVVIGVAAFASALALTPAAFKLAVTSGRFPAVTVCTKAGASFIGDLIAETDKRVYVGEPAVGVAVFARDDELRQEITGILQNKRFKFTLPARPHEVDAQQAEFVIAEIRGISPSDARRIAKIGLPTIGVIDPSAKGKRARKKQERRQRAIAKAAGIENTRLRSQVASDIAEGLIEGEIERNLNARAQKLTTTGNQEGDAEVAGNQKGDADAAAKQKGDAEAALGGKPEELANPKENRVVASIPASEVTRLLIGTDGRCPGDAQATP